MSSLDDIQLIARLVERARIRKAQAGALRNLRVLFAPECEDDIPFDVCTTRRHARDCPRRAFLAEIRALRAATRGER